MTRPFLTELLPSTNYEQPTAAEMSALRRIVRGVHDAWLGGGEGSEVERDRSFYRAFWVTGACFYRTREVRRDKYFSSFFEFGNHRLEENGILPTDERSFMLACLAHGDIVWQRKDPAVGALLELGLHEYHGAACSNRWRQILTGEAKLLAATPPRAPDMTIGKVHEFGGRMVK